MGVGISWVASGEHVYLCALCVCLCYMLERERDRTNAGRGRGAGGGLTVGRQMGQRGGG